jgi:AcrR family transcriptional regulator
MRHRGSDARWVPGNRAAARLRWHGAGQEAESQAKIAGSANLRDQKFLPRIAGVTQTQHSASGTLTGPEPGCEDRLREQLRQPESLRERKKLATRRALGLAAMRLAVERGLDNVVVDDIAAAAGVSPRTFSNYFASKYEAICSLAMDRMRLAGLSLRARPADEPLLEAITDAVLEPYLKAEQPPSQEWIDSWRLVIRSPELQGEYLRTLYAGQRSLADAIADRLSRSEPRLSMFPEVLAGAVTAAVQVALERWLGTDPPTALAPLIRSALGELRSGWLDGVTPGANSVAHRDLSPDADCGPREPSPVP